MCVIWADRHVHKNGGTSVRAVMRALMHEDVLQQAGGWQTSLQNWSAFFDTLVRLREPCSAPLRAVRLGVELHEGLGALADSEWLRQIQRLRQTPNVCCRVLLSLRVRNPLKHYVSSFQWGVEKRLAHRSLDGHICKSQVDPRCNASTTFRWWAPSNLQSRLLGRGDQWPWVDGNKWTDTHPRANSFGHAAFEHMIRIVDRDFDVVYPTEDFDAGLRLISHRLDLPREVFQNRSMPHVSPSFGGRAAYLSVDERSRSTPPAHICPDPEQCSALIQHVAPLDYKLYEHAVKSLSQLQAAPAAAPETRSAHHDAGHFAMGACRACSRSDVVRKKLHLAKLPDSVITPNVTLCGAGHVPIGSDASLAALHDALARTFGSHGTSGWLCYRRLL